MDVFRLSVKKELANLGNFFLVSPKSLHCISEDKKKPTRDKKSQREQKNTIIIVFSFHTYKTM